MKTKEKSLTLAAAKLKAKKYVDDNKVTVKSDDTDHELRTIRGKVKCDFGFIHHPAVILKEIESLKVVAASACDCYESNENNRICSHCEALVYKVYGEQNIPVLRDKSLSLYDEEKDTSYSFTIDIKSQEEKENGVLEVKGRAKCRFGFIHYPNILIKDNEMITYSCDCYMAAESTDACDHCKALYAKAVAAMPKKEVVVENQKPIIEDPKPEEPIIDDPKPEEPIIDDPEPEEPIIEDPKPEEPIIDDPEPEEPIIEDPEPEKPIIEEPVIDDPEPEEPIVDDPEPEEPIIDDPEPEEPIVDDPEPEEPVIDDPEPEKPIIEDPDDVVPPIELPEKQLFEQHEPTSMKILFGTDEETGEAVYWYPNDTSKLFHTNTGIIGTMGTGKTQFTKSIITQLYDEQPNNFTGRGLGILIFDYKGDYNETKPEFVEAVNARILKPYRIPFNPFALDGYAFKPRLPLHVASTFTDIVAKIYRLGPKQTTVLLHSIVKAYEKCGIDPGDPGTWINTPPTFKDVNDAYMNDVDNTGIDSLYAVMSKISQFELLEGDANKTVSLYNMLEGVCVMDLSGYDPSIQNLIVAIMLELFYSQMHNAGSSEISGVYRCMTKFILVDEADNFMSQKFPAIKKILKEGREFGVGMILATQFLRHFNSKEEDYAKYVLTWVVHNVADLKNSDIEFVFNKDKNSNACDEYFHEIKSLKAHTSLLKIANDETIHLKDKPFFELMNERKS